MAPTSMSLPSLFYITTYSLNFSIIYAIIDRFTQSGVRHWYGQLCQREKYCTCLISIPTRQPKMWDSRIKLALPYLYVHWGGASLISLAADHPDTP